MKILWLGFIFISFYFFDSVALAHRLSLDSLPTEISSDLLTHFSDLDFKTISLEQVDDVIRYLQEKKIYDFVQVFEIDHRPGGTKDLKIVVKKSERVDSVITRGLKGLSQFEFRTIFGVDPESRFSMKLIKDGVDRLKSAYQERAFFHAQVDIETIDLNNGRHRVIVICNEGLQSVIKKVIFAGDNSDLNSKLNREFRKFKEPYTQSSISLIQSRVRDFLNRERYLRTSLNGPESVFSSDESQVELKFTLDQPYSYSFDFDGVNHITGSTLEEEALKLNEFYSTNPNIGPELSSRIKSYYLIRGFSRVEVSVDEMDGRKEFTRQLIFHVEEGEKVKISKFVIGGHYSLPTSFYVDFIRDHSSSLVHQMYYNKEDVDAGVTNLINELKNRGYLQAKISSMMRVQYSKDKKQVTIYFNLEEGVQTQIEQVLFDGNMSFSKEQLLNEIGLPESGPLRLIDLESAVEKLKSFYLDNGFIDYQLANEKTDLITYDDSNIKANVKFSIKEGPQVRVGSILLEGNTFSEDKLILLELEMKVGDIVTPSKIEESIARIQRTGYFNSVEIKTLEEKTSVVNRTLMVQVKERNPGMFTLGTGVTNERDLTLRGYSGIAYRNLFGTGRGVSLRLDGRYNVTDIKFLENKLTLGYVEPYLLDSRVRGRINVTRDSSVTDYGLREITETRQTVYSLERDFTSHVLGVWEVLSFAAYEVFSLNPKINFPHQKIDIGSTDITLNFDYRDSPFIPTRGTLTTLNAEYGSPLLESDSIIEYYRALASLTFYVPVFKSKTVFATQIKSGVLENLSRKPDGSVPYEQKGFILGGRSTVRGFEAGTSEVFPNNKMLGSDVFRLKTRAEMFLIKSELRIPLNSSFGGSIFYDGGSVAIEGLNFSDNYRDSAGFGLNITTPVGPVNLELAWKLDMKPGESPWRFHLSMGYF